MTLWGRTTETYLHVLGRKKTYWKKYQLWIVQYLVELDSLHIKKNAILKTQVWQILT